MKVKSWVKLAVIVVLIALVASLALNGLRFGDYIKNSKISKYAIKPVGEAISLGLDLKGGISTVYTARDMNVEGFDDLMESTISVLRTRLTSAGYTEATVARQGDDAIRVEIPDVDDPQEVVDIIGKPAHLEFRDPSGNVILEGANIAECFVTQDQYTLMYQVAFELDAAGTQAFAEATGRLRGQAISIYLDGEEISSPTVNDAITGGTGVITYSDVTQEESWEKSRELALLIQSGALPLDIEESETRAISATLGFAAVDGAIIAGICGLIAIILFMIALYRLPGVAASIALLIYVLIVFYVLAIIEAQLTLQGIAGILLSIGMAVDANVIILERFREERKAGRTLTNALKFGYRNAFSSIIDSNVTTIIAAVVLLVFGTGSIKGFATTLLIGVLTSFFTAIFITRGIFKLIIKLGYKAEWLYSR
ncbi:MAG: protein translocase subunit SecD [Christensenellales bacterium]